jgi:predicted nuclease of predicted toxin-antitoxin system
VSVTLYLDHNVHAAIALGLRQRGVDVLVAFEDGYAESDDADVLERAMQLGRVVFTNDDDFLAIADKWQETGRPFAGVIYVHQLKMTVGQTIADLEIIAKAGNPEDLLNRIEYLPL